MTAKKYPHVQAAHINALAEEGTRHELIEWLQGQWNEICYLREAINSAYERAAEQVEVHGTLSAFDRDRQCYELAAASIHSLKDQG